MSGPPEPQLLYSLSADLSVTLFHPDVDLVEQCLLPRGATRVNGLEELVGYMRQEVCSDKADERC